MGTELMGLAPNRAGSPIVSFDEALDSFRAIPLSWDGFSRLHPLARDAFLGSDPRTGDAAMVMVYGDGWFGFTGGSATGYVGMFAEHNPMPEIREQGNRRLITGGDLTGQGVAVRDGVVTVLFEGATPEAKRWLDKFRLSDGSYIESLLLPHRINGFAVGPDDSYYVVFNNPVPTIQRLAPDREGLDR